MDSEEVVHFLQESEISELIDSRDQAREWTAGRSR